MSFISGTASGHYELATLLRDALSVNGSAFGLSYAGVGDGTFEGYRGGTASIAETFTITALSSSTWTVVGSVSGSLPNASTGSPYSQSKLAFTIVAGATAFQAGDQWILSTAPKWTVLRQSAGAVLTATAGNGGLYGVQNLADGKTVVSDTRVWRIEGPFSLPQDIEIQFRSSTTMSHYELGFFSSSFYSYMPSAWTLDLWNGSAWVTKDTQSGHTLWGPDEVKRFAIASPAASTLYRLHITATPYPADRMILGALRAFVGSNFGADKIFSEHIYRAPGNDGLQQFHCGLHFFERQDADYYNWELAAFDGFNTNGKFYEQAGIERRLFLPLKNASIPYWIVYDGRRAIVIAAVGTGYEVAILGAALDPYFSPAQWPSPQVLGGTLAFGEAARLPTWDSTEWRYSNASDHHRSPVHSDHGYLFIYAKNHEWYQLRARNLDGAWSGYESTVQDVATGTPDADQAIIWPYRCGLSNLTTNPDGSDTLWPILLCHPAPNIIGELAGIRCVSGQGLTPETLIRRGPINWLAVPNLTRTDRDDWFAVRLD